MPLPSIVQSTRTPLAAAESAEATPSAPLSASADAATAAEDGLATAAPESATSTAFAAAAPAQVLQFQVQAQQQTQWCWSAVTVSVAGYYSAASPWQQCTLAATMLNQQGCCPPGASAACNQPFVLDQPMQRVGVLGASFQGTLPFEGVEEQVQAQRPVGVRIGWYQGGGHFVTLYGTWEAQDGTPWVYVSDPMFGGSVYPYWNFATAYRGAGSWTNTYTTQP
jgi:Papain-like cysteine protease AvrRpt2